MQDATNLRNRTGRTRASVAISAIALSALAGCGGGEDGSTTAASPSTPTPSTLTGTVAWADALPGAIVTVTDTTGRTITTSTDENGIYEVPLAGLSQPLLITANDTQGEDPTLYSVTAGAQDGSSAPMIANVTVLTTAVVAELTPDGDPSELKSKHALKSVTINLVNQAETALPILLFQKPPAGMTNIPAWQTQLQNHPISEPFAWDSKYYLQPLVQSIGACDGTAKPSEWTCRTGTPGAPGSLVFRPGWQLTTPVPSPSPDSYN